MELREACCEGYELSDIDGNGCQPVISSTTEEPVISSTTEEPATSSTTEEPELSVPEEPALLIKQEGTLVSSGCTTKTFGLFILCAFYVIF